MKKFLSATICGLLAFGGAQAQIFTPGNLAILRVGDGVQALVKTGNALFLDQYTPTGALATTLVIPDAGPDSLILSGQSAPEGALTRSADRSVLALSAYNTDRGSVSGTISGTSGTTVPRGIANIDAFGQLNIMLRSTNYGSTNPRCVATTDGTNDFWGTGGANGTLYFNPPAMTPTTPAVTIQGSVGITRYIRIFNGNLYFTTSSPASVPVGIYDFSGLPMGPGATITNLFLATGQASSPSDFAIDPTGTFAYVADLDAGVMKWTNNAGVWSLLYTLGIGNTNGVFGLAVDFNGAHPVIYGTTTEGFDGDVITNRLVKWVDTNSAAVATTLALAGPNQAFRGIDFVPDLRPLIVTQPASAARTNGGSASFTVLATSPYSLFYQWQRSATNLAGANAATLNLSNLQTGDAGSYRVIVTNQSGSVTSAVATLTVTLAAVAPSITNQPTSQTNFIGSTVSLTVVAQGTDPLAYQWFFGATALGDGGEYSGTTSPTLVITSAQLADAGSYSVVITNVAGTNISQPAVLTLVQRPPAIVSQPGSSSIFAGQSLTFQVIATGTPDLGQTDLYYRWSFNGALLADHDEVSGTSTATLSISPVGTNNAGTYSVTVSNSVGVAPAVPFDLAVLVPPLPSYIAYANAGSVYTQNFDSLPYAPGGSVNTANPVVINSVTYSVANPFDFAFPAVASGNIGGLGLSNTMAGWYGFGFVASKVGAHNGDQTTGGEVSFGLTGNANRALGLLATGTTGATAFGARFVNATPDTLDHISLSFTGELWRQTGNPKTMSCSYFIDIDDPEINKPFNPANVTAALTSLNVAFAGATPPGPVNGTSAAYQTSKSVSNLVITNWPPGAVLWLVWQFSNAGSGGQGIAIDGFTFSASAGVPVVAPSLAIQLSGPTVLISWPASATGFVLQQSTNVAQANGWNTVGFPVVPAGGLSTVTVPATNSAQFFRLNYQ